MNPVDPQDAIGLLRSFLRPGEAESRSVNETVRRTIDSLEQGGWLTVEDAAHIRATLPAPAATPPTEEAERDDEAATWRQAAVYMRNRQKYFDEGEDAKAEFLSGADDFDRFAVEAAERAALASPAPQPPAPAPVEPPPAEQPFWCDKQGNVEMARCARPMGHAGNCLVPSPRLRGGGIISHAEIEDARKAQE